MSRSLNLGILAHVDAGKTTLTERLLYNAGVIDRIGRVDDGSTQADTLELERQRGITIKSAVVSFTIDEIVVNLIDTPGHPDFIAEVERVLGVLDGAVLVVSAVEGVQAQTRILMRALRRLKMPALIFVNKIDRAGADVERVLSKITDKLTPAAVALGSVRDQGSPSASFTSFGDGELEQADRMLETLAENDDELLAAYLADRLSSDRLLRELARQSRGCLAYPVLAGSAMTGAGMVELTEAITRLLPLATNDPSAPAAGTVFKVERGPSGEKVAYARMFAGTISMRDRIAINGGDDGKVTGIAVFDSGVDKRASFLRSGQIGKLWGLTDVRIGDTLGEPRELGADHHFAPPSLETTVVACHPSQATALRLALTELAEQDPLIDFRQDARRGLCVSLYGEVQKEVIQATLLSDYGLETTFEESRMICVERPLGSAEAVRELNAAGNPYLATVGLRIEPAPPGAGIRFRLDVDHHAVPLYLYKSIGGFADMMEEYVRAALEEGPHGWRVIDCVVTMTACRYSSWDGPPKYRGPLSTANDFRDLTPVVVRQALTDVGTRVCAPSHRFRLEVPTDAYGVVCAALAQAEAALDAPQLQADGYVLTGEIPAGQVHGMRQLLPGLTHGEGVLETMFSRYA